MNGLGITVYIVSTVKFGIDNNGPPGSKLFGGDAFNIANILFDIVVGIVTVAFAGFLTVSSLNAGSRNLNIYSVLFLGKSASFAESALLIFEASNIVESNVYVSVYNASQVCIDLKKNIFNVDINIVVEVFVLVIIYLLLCLYYLSFEFKKLLQALKKSDTVPKTYGDGEMLIEKIREDMMTAKKARNKLASDLLSTLYAEAIAVGRKTENRLPTDSEVIATVKKFIGNASETLTNVAGKTGYETVTENTKAEIEILNGYVPTQLTEGQLRNIVSAMVEAYAAINGGTAPVMGICMANLKNLYSGQYEGKLASAVVKSVLSSV